MMIKNILKLLYLAMLNLFNFLSHLAQTFTNYVPVYFCLNINMRVYAIYTSENDEAVLCWLPHSR